MIRDPAVTRAAMQMYTESQTGPMASPFGVCPAMLPDMEWTTSEGQQELEKILDEKLYFKSAITGNLPSIDFQYAAHRRSLENPNEASVMFALGTIQMHFQHALQKDIFSRIAPENYIVVLASLTSPLSRGSTHISSADPRVKPTIDPQYLVQPLDVEVFGR